MGILGILGVVVVRGMRDLRVQIAVVSLAKLSAAVIAAAALGRRRAFFPVDALAVAVVIGDKGVATFAAGGLPASPSPPCSGIAALAATAKIWGLSRVYRLLFEVFLDGRAHLGPLFRGTESRRQLCSPTWPFQIIGRPAEGSLWPRTSKRRAKSWMSFLTLLGLLN
jgi:hypothetical protein